MNDNKEDQLIRLFLTKEEFELIYSTVEYAESVASKRARKPGDSEDLKQSSLARLENELLWQAAHGTRRPVQQ